MITAPLLELEVAPGAQVDVHAATSMPLRLPMRSSQRSRIARGSSPASHSRPVRLAEGRADLEAAFRTLYEAYVRAGLATPNSYRMRIVPHQLLPTSDVIVAFQRGEIASTITLVGDGELGLPLEDLYAKEVARRRALRGCIAEASCLAERGAAAGAVTRSVLEVMGLMVQCAVRRGAAELLIAVHPRHASFYSRLGFEAIGEERTYRTVCDNPAVAMALNLDLRWIAENFPRTHRMFFENWLSDDAYRRRPLAPELAMEFREIVEDTVIERSAAA
jgi:hypothetical protein